jgi:hypothetical protein
VFRWQIRETVIPEQPSNDLLVDTVGGAVVLAGDRSQAGTARGTPPESWSTSVKGPARSGEKKRESVRVSARAGRHSEGCVPGALCSGGRHPGSHQRSVRSRGGFEASLGCHRRRRTSRSGVRGGGDTGCAGYDEWASASQCACSLGVVRPAEGLLSAARSSTSGQPADSSHGQRAKRGPFEEWSFAGRARPS